MGADQPARQETDVHRATSLRSGADLGGELGLTAAFTEGATVNRLAACRRGANRHRGRDSVTHVWAASTSVARAGAVLTATATALCVVVLDIPVASGLAVLALIPAMLIDLAEQRIPDRWIMVAAGSFGFAIALSTALGQSVSTPSIIAGAAAMMLPILFLHLISPAAMGFGDVKAAIVLGSALGLVNWQLALVGLTLAAGTGATIGTMRRSRMIAFGPYLLVGTLIALAASSVVLDTAIEGGVR